MKRNGGELAVGGLERRTGSVDHPEAADDRVSRDFHGKASLADSALSADEGHGPAAGARRVDKQSKIPQRRCATDEGGLIEIRRGRQGRLGRRSAFECLM